eukprot:1776607-Pyramimonas_sp.AAC.1
MTKKHNFGHAVSPTSTARIRFASAIALGRVVVLGAGGLESIFFGVRKHFRGGIEFSTGGAAKQGLTHLRRPLRHVHLERPLP